MITAELQLLLSPHPLTLTCFDVFVCKQLLFGTYSSFEYLSVLLNNSAKIILLIIYRPTKYSVTFFDEFAELISIIVTEFDCVIITGDFKIHVDNQNDVQEFLTILENVGLTQHVKEPTHNKGHILDLVVSKGLHLSNVTVFDAAVSDHFCVLSDTSVIVDTCTRSHSVKKQYLSECSSIAFSQAISMIPSFMWTSVFWTILMLKSSMSLTKLHL